jgi:hypothetical protein
MCLKKVKALWTCVQFFTNHSQKPKRSLEKPFIPLSKMYTSSKVADCIKTVKKIIADNFTDLKLWSKYLTEHSSYVVLVYAGEKPFKLDDVVVWGKLSDKPSSLSDEDRSSLQYVLYQGADFAREYAKMKPERVVHHINGLFQRENHNDIQKVSKEKGIKRFKSAHKVDDAEEAADQICMQVAQDLSLEVAHEELSVLYLESLQGSASLCRTEPDLPNNPEPGSLNAEPESPHAEPDSLENSKPDSPNNPEPGPLTNLSEHQSDALTGKVPSSSQQVQPGERLVPEIMPPMTPYYELQRTCSYFERHSWCQAWNKRSGAVTLMKGKGGGSKEEKLPRILNADLKFKNPNTCQLSILYGGKCVAMMSQGLTSKTRFICKQCLVFLHEECGPLYHAFHAKEQLDLAQFNMMKMLGGGSR